MILFGLRDVGSVNACLPVINILKKNKFPVSVYAEGPAYERCKDKFTVIPEIRTDDLLDLINPSLVVATCATPGGCVPIVLTCEAKKRKLPVVLIEEMWAGHRAFLWDILPDGVCVIDKFSKNLIQRSWPNYPEFHIHVTGSPVFDKFIEVDIESAKRNLREKLGLKENWPVIFFPATGLVAGMQQVIQMLIEALNSLHIPVYFILRDHPSVTYLQALEYRARLADLKIGQIIDSSNLTSNDVNAGSDIIIGTFSTMTVEACYMRKPVLIISTLEIRTVLTEATNHTLEGWPITNLGAALKAESVEEIQNSLLSIIAGDIKDMKLAQEKHCKTDGLNGERIAEAILNYYQ